MPFAAAGAIAGVASAATGIAGAIGQSGKSGAGASQAAGLSAQQRADLEPWRTTGGVANTASADLLGLNGTDAANAAFANYRTSPGYEFQLSEGLRGVDAGAAAKGLLRSGATLKAEQTFGAGLADSDFGQYYNRLMGISQLGESAAAGGAYTAANAANNAQGAGDTQAGIYGNAAKGIGEGVNKLFSNDAFTSGIGGGGVVDSGAWTI